MSELPYQGRFVWHDVLTTNPTASATFFHELVGWRTETREMGGGRRYTVLSNARTLFGGIMPLDPGAVLDSHWLSYISTVDVDDFCARASDMGATIATDPTSIPGVGRYAIVADPQGARFAPYTDAERVPPQAPPTLPGEPGDVVWSALMTTDPAAATAFYTRLFGWNARFDERSGGPWTILEYDGIPVAGIRRKNGNRHDPAWTIVIQVEDIESTLQRIVALGGSVMSEATEISPLGSMSWASEPGGAVFAIRQNAPAAGQNS